MLLPYGYKLYVPCEKMPNCCWKWWATASFSDMEDLPRDLNFLGRAWETRSSLGDFLQSLSEMANWDKGPISPTGTLMHSWVFHMLMEWYLSIWCYVEKIDAHVRGNLIPDGALSHSCLMSSLKQSDLWIPKNLASTASTNASCPPATSNHPGRPPLHPRWSHRVVNCWSLQCRWESAPAVQDMGAFFSGENLMEGISWKDINLR